MCDAAGAGDGPGPGPGTGPWQRDDGRCAAVLHEVFSWLSGPELALAGAACRSWRYAAADRSLWRHLLLRRAGIAPCAARGVPWRQEYVSTYAGWRLHARLAAPGGLSHAALAPRPAGGARLALLGEGATVAIWQREAAGAPWERSWCVELAERGWRSAERAEWAAGGARLLLAGALALSARWELLVLDVDGAGGRVASRARCGAGAAGCWADAAGAAFLSLDLSALAPSVACTTVWLNSSTQETQSEYAGVTSALLRIYNEDAAHVTFIAVAQVPLDAIDDDHAAYRGAAGEQDASAAVLLAASGHRAGAGLLRAWPLGARRPAALRARARGDLRARVLRRRQAAAGPAPAPAPAPAPPDEASVRALCSPPHDCRVLPAPAVGCVVPAR